MALEFLTLFPKGAVVECGNPFFEGFLELKPVL